MKSVVEYHLQDRVATIVMDDGKANAMSVSMFAALNAALDRALQDQAVVVLSGRKDLFSGGFDLAAFKGSLQGQARMLEAGARIAERLLSFPLPVVAACTGHAIAMGAFLLLSSDVRVGVDNGMRIQLNEVANGMTLPHFAVEVCRHRLAPASLNTAALTAFPFSAQQALSAGFLDEVVAAESLASTTFGHATRLASLHAQAFAASKLRVRRPVIEALQWAIRADLADWTARIPK